MQRRSEIRIPVDDNDGNVWLVAKSSFIKNRTNVIRPPVAGGFSACYCAISYPSWHPWLEIFVTCRIHTWFFYFFFQDDWMNSGTQDLISF